MIINGNYHYDTGHQHKNCRQTRRKVGKRYQVILFMGSKRPAFFFRFCCMVSTKSSMWHWDGKFDSYPPLLPNPLTCDVL